MRAVSHGCIRVGDPQGLALSLFGAGKKYNMIVEKMAEDNPAPTTISLSPKVPVYITYVTAWAQDNGNIEVRKDVYGLDIVLFANLQKLTD
jgi:murein L,D-transpeptidase YcbB/YkuD